VHNPQKEKLMQEREREARDFNEVKARFDKEKMFIDAQKDQAKKLNHMQLMMQKEEQNFITNMQDDSQFQKNQARMQAQHNAQMNQYEEFARKKNQLNYRQMLD